MLYKVLGSLTLLLALLILGTWQLRTTVRVEHTFNAAPADVWRVWNNAGSIQKWWGAERLHRTCHPERCATGWQLSLGD